MNDEAKDLQARFFEELKKCTADGQGKRKKGKPPWYIDPDHERAIFSHLTKWKAGELVDPDSGAHPLVHVAWRCLAIACVETGNVPDVPSTCEHCGEPNRFHIWKSQWNCVVGRGPND